MSGTRYSNCIYNVHIADGFADDCEELILRCSQKDPLTFQSFGAIWKEMNLCDIYRNRSLGSEVAELSEELIFIAKRYMVANTSNFEESVAGLFLVYALLNLQPFSGFAPLRLVPEDEPAIKRIEFVARRDRRYDVLYILGSVQVKGPCQFQCEQREKGMELQLRKYLEGLTGIDSTGVRPKGIFYRQNEVLDLLRDLNTVFRRYSKSKSSIRLGSQDDLQYSDHTTMIKVENTLKKIINGVVDDEDDPEASSSNRSRDVQGIKSKAMRLTVDPMRHLTSVSDRKAGRASPKRSPNYVTKPGKGKTCSPKRISSPRKRIINAPKKSKTKRRRREHEDPKSSSSDDLDLDSFVKPSEYVNDNDIEQNNDKVDDAQTEQELDIEINSLPVLIRTDDEDKLIEIEIIDQYRSNEKEEEIQDEIENPGYIDEGSKRKLRKKLLRSKDITVEKVKEKGKCSNTTLDPQKDNGTEMAKLSIISQNDDVFKKPAEIYQLPKLRKREKRDLKKPILMSKFKRLGMLPMANFRESD